MTQKQPDKISVIIPVYNVEKWLRRCLDSLLCQTYSNLQIILIDDGSMDQSGSICDEYACMDPRVEVLHKSNGGLSDARNAGMKLAKADYISFIDSDDWVAVDFLEHLMELVTRYNCDCAGCGHYVVSDKKGDYKDASDNTINVLKYDNSNALKRLITGQIKQVVWNKLYRKNLIIDIPFEKGKLHEDEYWSYQVFHRITHYVESTYKGYYYFKRSGSIMGEGYSIKRLDAIKAKVARQRYMEIHAPEYAVISRMNLRFSCLYHGQMALQNLKNPDKRKVLRYLKKVVSQNTIKLSQIRKYKFTHKCWIGLSEHFFTVTCYVRNLLHIGF